MAKDIIAIENPLAVDDATVKEFGITDETEISPIKKLGFLQAQLEELEAQCWRNRVDIIHAKRLQQSDIEALKDKGFRNMSEHKNTVKQFTDGIRMIKRLITQLREAYPELRVEE